MLLHYPRIHCQPNRHTVSSWVDGWSWMVRQTVDQRIPVFLEISSTNWHGCGASSWLNMTIKIKIKNTIKIAFFAANGVHGLWTPFKWTDVEVCFSSLRRLRSFQVLLGDSFMNSSATYPLGIYKLLTKVRSSLLNSMFTNMNITVTFWKYVFRSPRKNAK